MSVDRELSVDVGHDACLCSLDDCGGANDGLPVMVYYAALHCDCIGCRWLWRDDNLVTHSRVLETGLAEFHVQHLSERGAVHVYGDFGPILDFRVAVGKFPVGLPFNFREKLFQLGIIEVQADSVLLRVSRHGKQQNQNDCKNGMTP